jgi:hypothetical protein
MKEQLLLQLIKDFKQTPADKFYFREVNKLNTLRLLYALRGFHSEEGTTKEQDELLIACGLMSRI